MALVFLVARLAPALDGGRVAVPPPDEATVVPWDEARAHLGERAYVRGPVVGAYWAEESRGRPTFLNLGRDHPDPDRVTAFIPGDARNRFESPPEERYLNETILVYGKLREYEGAVEVEVTNPDQIVIRSSADSEE